MTSSETPVDASFGGARVQLTQCAHYRWLRVLSEYRAISVLARNES